MFVDVEYPDWNIQPLIYFFGLLDAPMDGIVVGSSEVKRKDFLKLVELWQSYKRVRGGMSIVDTVVYFPWQQHK